MKPSFKPKMFMAAAVASISLIASTASAVPILGGSVVVATDGDVIATFLGHTAGYSNDLYLDSPAGTYASTIIFNNHTTPVGTAVNLGSFTAGTELIFRIYVRNTGYTFYTGPASRNPDNLVHAVVDDEYSATQTYVGFEDLFGGGDLDYDDLNFAFSNVRGTVRPPGVPDAGATLPLLGATLLTVGYCVRRRS